MKKAAIMWGVAGDTSFRTTDYPGFVFPKDEQELRKLRPGLLVLVGSVELPSIYQGQPPCPVFRFNPEKSSDFPTVAAKSLQDSSLKSWFIQDFDVLAHVSHEMRSPMSVISMACQLARQSKSCDERVQRHLELIDGASNSLKSLINDILDYSKLADGSFTLTVVDFDLHRLLEALRDGFALLAEEKGIALGMIMAGEVPVNVNGDPGRIRQVLTNLLSNAVKFTQKGQVTLRVIAEDDLVFEVEDSGIGIAPEAQERIFEPYKQATDDTNVKFGGTGLGLTICRTLVEKMGGEISVESQFGKGSCFRFNLPLVSIEPRPACILKALPPGLRLLTVAEHFPLSWTAHFQEVGLDIHACRSSDLLSTLDDTWFDLSIVDLETFRFRDLLSLDREKTQAFGALLLITGAGQRGDAKLATELGARAYISLPFSAEKLVKAMLLCLDPIHRQLVTRYTIEEQYPDIDKGHSSED